MSENTVSLATAATSHGLTNEFQSWCLNKNGSHSLTAAFRDITCGDAGCSGQHYKTRKQ